MKQIFSILYIFLSINLIFAQTPINDWCSNAVNISINNNLGTASSGTSVQNATPTTNPSTCSSLTGSIARDVWFKFTATSTEHTVTVDPSSGLDAVLDVRTGNCNGTFFMCVDNGGGKGHPETLAVQTTVGQEYLIRIYHYTTFNPSNSNSIPITSTFSLKIENQPVSNTCNTPTGISENNITANSATLVIPSVSGALEYEFDWREVGGSWSTENENTNQTTITGLSANTDYEWEGRVKCADGTWTSYSNESDFTTLNSGVSSCNTPTGIWENNITTNSATLKTHSVTGALVYEFRWREVGGSWSIENENTNETTITGLSPSTNYQWEARVQCANGTWTNYSNTSTFVTSTPLTLSYLDVGNIRIYADNIPTSGSIRQLSGNVRLSLKNGVGTALKVDGSLEVSLVPSDLYIKGNTRIYMDNVPYINGDLDLYSGSFKFGVSADEMLKEILSDVNQKLKMAKLPTPITNITLVDNGIEIEGKIELPAVVEDFFSNRIKASTDKIRITTTNGIQLNGQVGLYDIKISKTITLNHLILTYLAIDSRFECDAEIEVYNFFQLGTTVIFQDGGLDAITVNYVPVVPKPIGTTGLGFTEVTGSVRNIQNGPLTLEASIDLVPTIQHSLDIVKLNDLSLTYVWNTSFTGSGNLTLFNKHLAEASITMTKYSLGLGGKINLYDFLDFNVSGSIAKTNNKIRLRGDFGGIAQVPSQSKLDELPRWFRIPAREVIDYFNFNPGDVFAASQNVIFNDVPTNSDGGLFGNFKTDYVASTIFGNFTIPKVYYSLVWDGGLDTDFGLNYNFMPIEARNALDGIPKNTPLANSNKSFPLGTGNGNEIQFDVALATNSLLVEVEAIGTPNIEIELPDGTIIKKQNVNSFFDISYFEEQNYGIFHFTNPQLGKYIVEKSASNDSITVRSANNLPAIRIKKIIHNETDRTFNVKWDDNDHDDDALISIGLAKDVTGLNYVEFKDSISENSTSNSFLIDYSNFPTGIYYAKATIRDKIGQASVAYSDKSYKIIEENAPIAPTGLTTLTTDTSIVLSWNKTASNQNSFIIYYSSDTGVVSYNASSFGVGDKTSFSVTELEPGKYYEFIVTALDTFSRESDYSNIATASYISTTLNNVPVLQQPNATILEVNNNWNLQLQATDADNDVLTFQLLDAPNNLSITNQGLITWAPANNQLYNHTVEVKVKDGKGGSDIKSFDLLVLNDNAALAQVELNKSVLTNHSDKALINILDRNKENASFEIFDTAHVRIYSTSDLTGVSLVASEKNASSNEYSILFRLSENSSTGNQLFVQNRDSIWVEYYDRSDNKIVKNLARFIELEADFDIPLEVCSGDEINILNVSIGSGLKYNWNINGTVYTEKNPKHIFIANSFGNGQETQNIQLSITDAENRKTSKTITILVNQRPALDISTIIAACDEVIIDTQNPMNHVVWSEEDTANIKTFHESRYETIEVTNAYGCISRDTVQIDILNTMELSNIVDPILCYGGTADIDLHLLKGTAPFNYTWNNTATSQDLDSILVGTYEVIVIDSNSCERKDTIIITEPSAVVSSFTTVNNLCYGEANGTIDVNVSGGVGGYNYDWTGSNSSSNQLSNLLSGTYSVDITDANGCLVTEDITIYEPTDISLTANTVDVACHGDNTGKIVTSLFGGTAPYNYSWSDGNTDVIRENLIAGMYQMTLTDANGCLDSVLVQINEPSPVITTTISIDNDCNGSQVGTIDLAVNGGITPYSYLWNNGSQSQDLNNLAAGIYHATITDANLCTHFISDTINEPTALSIIIAQSDVLCNGGNTGSINLTTTGGTGNLTYNWNDGTQGNQRNNLIAGTYTASITDDNGCLQIETIQVNEPNELTSTHAILEPTCFGFSDGGIDITATGGLGNYNYSWSNSDTTEDVSALASGNYTLTITDENNCTHITTIQVTEPDSLNIATQLTPPLCEFDANGAINTSVTGGTAPYTYWWNNQVQTASMSNLPAGNYDVIITDMNGCQDSAAYQLMTPNPLSISTSFQDEICTSQSGQAIATPIGGTAPYQYIWNSGDTTAIINNLSGGVYIVTITDVNSCTKTQSVGVPSINPMTVSTTLNHVSCHNQSNANIFIIPMNGTAPFNYNWNNGSTTQNQNNISGGNYIVTITDANGCIAMVDTNIIEPQALNVGFSNIVHACNGNNGTLNANIGGGTNPISYTWTGTSQTSSQLTNLTAGNYSITATDVNGCTVLSNSIKIYETPLADFTHQLNDLTVDITDLSNSAQILSWDFGDGNNSFVSNPTHTYDDYGVYNLLMTVSNPCGIDTMLVTLNIFPTNTISIDNNCLTNVYPNPSQGVFYLQIDCLDTKNDYSIEVYNNLGQIVKSYNNINIFNEAHQVNLSTETTGLYFVVVKENQETIIGKQKILINR